MSSRKRNQRRSALNGSMSAEEWNNCYPVGTPVRYWPILPPIDGAPPEDTKTRSEAWALGHGDVVVKVEGRTGGVLLSHIEVMTRESGKT